MSTTPMSSGAAAGTSEVSTVPLRLEVIRLPVADFDRAKAFYQRLGWRFDTPGTWWLSPSVRTARPTRLSAP